MSSRRRTTPRPARGRMTVLLAVVAVVVTALAIVVGRAVLVDEPVDTADGPAATPSPGRPPRRSPTTTATASRWCGRPSAGGSRPSRPPWRWASTAAARDADAAVAPVAWRPGMRVPGTDSVANEWGCSVKAGDVTASAWVFGVPVRRSLRPGGGPRGAPAGTAGARRCPRSAPRGSSSPARTGGARTRRTGAGRGHLAGVPGHRHRRRRAGRPLVRGRAGRAAGGVSPCVRRRPSPRPGASGCRPRGSASMSPSKTACGLPDS